METSRFEMNEERRTAILESLGRKEGDVMEDDQGEYVMVETGTYHCDDCLENEIAEVEKQYLSDVEID